MKNSISNPFATAKVTRDFVWNYHIRSHERFNAYDAWYYCRYADNPLNTLLEFEFVQGADPTDDVERVRMVTHYCRIAIKRLGIENYAIWTRHISIGSRFEKDMVLVHVPETELDDFKTQAESWNFDSAMSPIKVTKVDYEKSFQVNGKFYNVMDVMCRSLDPKTRREEPDSLYEPSEPLFKPVIFQSLKLRGEMAKARAARKNDIVIDQ